MGEEVFVDANIFLEILLKDTKSEECKDYLKSMEGAFTTDFVLYSCLLIVQKSLKNLQSMKDAVVFFNNLPNLKILRPSFDELHSAIGVIGSEKLDFDDSLVVACMRSYGIKKLASLDRHFDKVKGIERIRL